MRIELTLNPRTFIILLACATLVLAALLTTAYNSGQPASIVGHSPEELQVDSTSIVDGSINSSNINTTQVQQRVASTCGAGSSIRIINEDGTVTCETDDGADGVGFTTKSVFTSSGTGSASACCPGSPGNGVGGGCTITSGTGAITTSIPYNGCSSSNGWTCTSSVGTDSITVYLVCIG